MELQFHPEPARKLSTNLYDIYHCCVYSEKTPDDGQRNCPKHVDFHSKNIFEKLVHLVGFIIRNLTRCTVTGTLISSEKLVCLYESAWRHIREQTSTSKCVSLLFLRTVLAKQSGCSLREANGPILGRPPLKRSHSARSDDSVALFFVIASAKCVSYSEHWSDKFSGRRYKSLN